MNNSRLTVGYFHDETGALLEAVLLESGNYMDSTGRVHTSLPDFNPFGTVVTLAKFFTG